ncbi:ubiquinone biosynthesis regulatory protein kinase UbiB [Xanthomonadaceae bacterium JHOS43]|nr:ubiquinone biosynthesis regulatory protein kinase UbiB [Xanthomonadaceae bacterium JHOS43]
MLSRLRGAHRVWQVGRILLRYRLDELFVGTSLERRMALLRPLAPRPSAEVAAMSRGARLRLALQELGPIFVKFGQVLSTRRDIMPPDVADELAMLRDQVAPFDTATARRQIEDALGGPVDALFAAFDNEPLASASIAQVHAATLADGREVVVKVLRPDIHTRIQADITLMRTLAGLVEKHHPRAHRIRPNAVVDEIEATLQAELDLQREGANASVLSRHWQGSPDLYIPGIVWSHTRESVLTLERVRGIASDNIVALDAAGIDRRALAAKAVRVFYEQVFRDNFFHADAHAGNIWVDPDPSRATDPRFIALDFGIVGQLSPRDQYWLAENFMAIFRRDYRRIAELHLAAGWMPTHVRTEELEAAARAVCEPYFTRPLSEFSLGEVLLKLFRTAQRYELTLQPQLILMQKTLLNVEGLARLLDPDLDVWAVARPVLERILRERYSPARLRREFRRRLPELMSTAPDMPRLVHAWLTQQVDGEHAVQLRSHDLAALARAANDTPRRIVRGVLGSGLLVGACVLFAFDANGPRWLDLPISAWATATGALLAFLGATRRSPPP